MSGLQLELDWLDTRIRPQHATRQTVGLQLEPRSRRTPHFRLLLPRPLRLPGRRATAIYMQPTRGIPDEPQISGCAGALVSCYLAGQPISRARAFGIETENDHVYLVDLDGERRVCKIDFTAGQAHDLAGRGLASSLLEFRAVPAAAAAPRSRPSALAA
jgi:hypothetical protein